MMARVSVHKRGQENNSEQHSCPTQLNSLLQLHSPYMAASADLFLSGSPCTLLCSQTRESAVSFNFNAIAVTSQLHQTDCVMSTISLSRVHRSFIQPFLTPFHV